MKLILLLSFIVLFGIAGASTVTLTGTCYSNLVNNTNNFIQFNLTNSGNGTATNLAIVPLIQGASTNNTAVTIPIVAPGTSYPEKIYLYNFTTPGTYVERFLVRYSQGTSTFETIFPCLTDFVVGTQSMLTVSNLGETSNGSIVVNITNAAAYPIDSQVTLYAPPAFNVTMPIKNATIDSHGVATVSFDVTPPSYTNAKFPVAVGVAYMRSGIHYSTLAVTTITFGGIAKAVPKLGDTLLLLSLLATVIIIIILIVVSILLSRKKKRRKEIERKEKEAEKVFE
ncbi:MAG: hypothetical protein KGI06_02380 [Candidatus Micrarchaeota archaeon]|nr:hypothetical protein [Candidatus Micrarchaeota archaeon]